MNIQRESTMMKSATDERRLTRTVFLLRLAIYRKAGVHPPS
jgi:hypothetical protein